MNYLNDKKNWLFYLISGINAKYGNLVNQSLKKIDLTMGQYGVLKTISQKEGSSQTELAEVYDTDRTTMMVICDSLCKKGLAVRKPAPGDRRKNLVYSTDKGREILNQANLIVDELATPVFDLLTEEKLSNVLPTLEELYKMIKSMKTKE